MVEGILSLSQTFGSVLFVDYEMSGKFVNSNHYIFKYVNEGLGLSILYVVI